MFFHFPPGNPAPRQKLDKLWIWILYSASLDVFGQGGQNLDKGGLRRTLDKLWTCTKPRQSMYLDKLWTNAGFTLLNIYF